MLLHVFVKRLPGGAPAVESLHYTDDWFESPKILISSKAGDNVEFCVCENGDKTHIIDVNTRTHGYEIINNTGVIVDRHVSVLHTDTVNG